MSSGFHVDFIEQLDSSTFRIEGYSIGDKTTLSISTSTGEAKLEANGASHIHRDGEDERRVKVLTAKFTLNPSKDTIGVLDASTKNPLKIYTNQFSGFTSLRYSYRKFDSLIIRKSNSTHLSVQRCIRSRLVLFEVIYLLRIIFNWRIPAARDALFDSKASPSKRLIKSTLIIAESIVMIPRGILLRVAYRFARIGRGRSIWLVSDRGAAAGDNGEALFRYIRQVNDTRVDAYFVLSKESEDYARLSSYGKVLDPGSLKYKLLFLLADKIISSHADIEVTNPFLRQRDHFVDLFNFDFIFLQHGIIRNDLSGWLNRYEKNIKLFITSAQKEYDSILAYPYYYAPSNIILSGLPRYDLLDSRPRGKVIVTPTYRKDLLRLKTDKYGKRGHDASFKKSNYYDFYNKLIHDSKVHEAMQEADLVGEFYIHPNFAAQRQDFTASKVFQVMEYPYDYQKALNEGVLLVSDYSSIVLDFAYLKKPVIYTHFDEDTFFQGHSYERGDFFSDEHDGFGSVTETYDDLVKEIIALIESGCAMPNMYKKRVEDFFYWHDKGNSKRVYDAILGISDDAKAV